MREVNPMALGAVPVPQPRGDVAGGSAHSEPGSGSTARRGGGGRRPPRLSSPCWAMGGLLGGAGAELPSAGVSAAGLLLWGRSGAGFPQGQQLRGGRGRTWSPATSQSTEGEQYSSPPSTALGREKPAPGLCFWPLMDLRFFPELLPQALGLVVAPKVWLSTPIPGAGCPPHGRSPRASERVGASPSGGIRTGLSTLQGPQ